MANTDAEELGDDTLMQARRTTLTDGRYLIYFTFSIGPVQHAEAETTAPADDSQAG